VSARLGGVRRVRLDLAQGVKEKASTAFLKKSSKKLLLRFAAL
jgi:hypothetical protein